jgi:hypothetical protein
VYLRVQQLALLYIETWFIDGGMLLAFILPSHYSIFKAQWSFSEIAQTYITIYQALLNPSFKAPVAKVDDKAGVVLPLKGV